MSNNATPNPPPPLAIPNRRASYSGWPTTTGSSFPPTPTSPATAPFTSSSLASFGSPPNSGSPPVYNRRFSFTAGSFGFQDPFPNISHSTTVPSPASDAPLPLPPRTRSVTLPAVLTSSIPSLSTPVRASSVATPRLEHVKEEEPFVRGWFGRSQGDGKKREKSPMRDAILTGQFLD